MGLWSGQHGNLQFLSPVAILVGAAVSSQVEDEKALGEFICKQQRRGMRFAPPLSSPKPLPLCTGPGPLEDVLLMQAQGGGQRGGRAERREGTPGPIP